jgi:hypothetical protein
MNDGQDYTAMGLEKTISACYHSKLLRPFVSVTPVQAEVPRADPQASAVADLYGVIGRALKRLDDTHGQDATFDLWPRFRLIHIFEALRTRDGRLEAHEALRYLEREIARRSR